MEGYLKKKKGIKLSQQNNKSKHNYFTGIKILKLC